MQETRLPFKNDVTEKMPNFYQRDLHNFHVNNKTKRLSKRVSQNFNVNNRQKMNRKINKYIYRQIDG